MAANRCLIMFSRRLKTKQQPSQKQIYQKKDMYRSQPPVRSLHVVSAYRTLCLLMSSMVKEEYSLSSSGSCCDWLLVRTPYMGTDTSWIWIWSSGEELSWSVEKKKKKIT